MSEATENTEATFEAMPGADPVETAEAASPSNKSPKHTKCVG